MNKADRRRVLLINAGLVTPPLVIQQAVPTVDIIKYNEVDCITILHIVDFIRNNY